MTDPYTKAKQVLNQPLIYQETKDLFFVETDKAIYRGGDVVNFRVFSVDSDTRPRNVNTATVTIFDSNNVQIQAFINVTFVKGKYEGSLQLSQNPPYGSWRLSVTEGVAVS